MLLVLDASVALKWCFRSRPAQADTGVVLALLQALGSGAVTLHQPGHFVAEVAAVLARELPDQALPLLGDLLDIQMQVIDSPAVMARAVDLAARHQHPLFDTLYHAVALETEGALLVTADAAYLRKAAREGQIVSLAQWGLGAYPAAR